jgi:hypothetical protein
MLSGGAGVQPAPPYRRVVRPNEGGTLLGWAVAALLYNGVFLL